MMQSEKQTREEERKERLLPEIWEKVESSIPEHPNKKELISYFKMDFRSYWDDSFKDSKKLFERELKFNHADAEKDWNKFLAGVNVKTQHLIPKDEEKPVFLRLNFAKHKLGIYWNIAKRKCLSLKQLQDAVKWGRIMKQYRDMAIVANLGLVSKMSNGYFDEGVQGLMRAVDQFDVGRGFRFSTYACDSISKAAWRGNSKKITLETREQSTSYDITPETKVDREGIFPSVYKTEFKNILQENLARLTTRESEVIRLRFHEGMTLNNVGTRFNLSKERVRQIQKDVFRKLRLAMKKSGYYDERYDELQSRT